MRDKHDEARIDERRRRVADMYLRGQTQREIGAALGVDHSTVCRDLAALRRDWQQAAAADFNERASQELALIDHLEVIAWQGWERSCHDAETLKASKTKVRSTKDGVLLPDLEKTEKMVRGQAGDPRFLERIEKCIRMRCEMLGLLKPENSGVTTAVTVINGVDLDAILGRKPGITISQPSEN